MSDEELDRLFKASAENFDPPFDPDAWTAMEKKLGKVPVRHRWFKKFAPFIALVLLVSISTLFLPIDAPIIDVIPTIITKKEGDKSERYKEPQEEQRQNGKTYIIQDGNFSKITGKTEISVAEISVRKKQNHTLVPLVKEVGSSSAITHLPMPEGKHSLSLTEIASGDPASSVKIAVVNSRGLNIEVASKRDSLLQSSTEEFARRGSVAASTLPGDTTQAEVPTQDRMSQDSISAEKEQKEQVETSWFLNSVQLALAIAPDLTTVKFKNADALSVNAGILVGIPLSRKVSLVTGVIWANKVYDAQPEDYTSAGGYTYTSTIEATCRVLDIPVNIRYNVLTSGSNMLAVQAGLSSYVMLHEKYSSGYSNGYGGSYDYTYEVDNKNRHWLQVQNVSLVYTRAVTPVFSVGVEPFVKIPYAGIGAGKVNLTSAGVFFSAGYTIKLKP